MKITEKLKMIIKCALAMEVKEVVTDKATLLYDAEELTEGVEVFTKVEEELVPAEDGTYTAEDGTIYEVAEGKISTITPKAEEEIVEEQPIEAEEVVEVTEPVTEPIEEEPVEDKIDVEAAIKELQDKVVVLTDAMTEITNTIATLKAELEKIKTEPAAEPIDEEPKVEEPIKASKMSYLRKK